MTTLRDSDQPRARELRELRISLKEKLDEILGRSGIMSEADEREAAYLGDRIGRFGSTDGSRAGTGLAAEIEAAEARETFRDSDGDGGIRKQYGDVPTVHVGGGGGAVGLAPDESFAEYCSRNGLHERGGHHEVSLGAMCRAMALGPQNDIEARALSEGSDAVGGAAIPSRLASQIIDNLRAKSVVFQAGCPTVPLTTKNNDFARLSGDATPTWRAEAAESTLSDPTFSKVTFAPKTLRVLTKISRELWEDAQNLDDALRTSLAGVFAAAVDAAVLTGASSDGSPVGILNWSTNVGTFNAGLVAQSSTTWVKFDDYRIVTGAAGEILVDNAPFPTACIMNPRDFIDLGEAVDSQGQPKRKPDILADMKLLPTTALPSTFIVTYGGAEGSTLDASKAVVGHFPHSVVGIRNEMRLEILKERYGEYFQYGLLAFMRMDHQLWHPESFCVVDHLSPTATTA